VLRNLLGVVVIHALFVIPLFFILRADLRIVLIEVGKTLNVLVGVDLAVKVTPVHLFFSEREGGRVGVEILGDIVRDDVGLFL
jgi:hypothetical protein